MKELYVKHDVGVCTRCVLYDYSLKLTECSCGNVLERTERMSLVCRICRGEGKHRYGCPYIAKINQGFVQCGQGIDLEPKEEAWYVRAAKKLSSLTNYCSNSTGKYLD